MLFSCRSWREDIKEVNTHVNYIFFNFFDGRLLFLIWIFIAKAADLKFLMVIFFQINTHMKKINQGCELYFFSISFLFHIQWSYCSIRRTLSYISNTHWWRGCFSNSQIFPFFVIFFLSFFKSVHLLLTSLFFLSVIFVYSEPKKLEPCWFFFRQKVVVVRMDDYK